MENTHFSGLEGYFSAITALVFEFNENAPLRVEFGDEDQIIYYHTSQYILGIVCTRDYKKSHLYNIQAAFKRRFSHLCQSSSNTSDELISEFLVTECEIKEKKQINSFDRYLNQRFEIQNKYRSDGALQHTQNDTPGPLVISNVDLLIASSTGQPIYFMQTLTLLYEPSILASFIAAIQDLGKALGIGTIKRIVAEKIDIFIAQLKKAFAFVLTLRNGYPASAYRRFASFVANFCNNWLEEKKIEMDEALSIYDNRNEFESFLQLIIESDSWHIHKIKEREREIVEKAALNSLAEELEAVNP